MSVQSWIRTTSVVLAVVALAGCGEDAVTPVEPAAEVIAVPPGLVTLEWQEQARTLAGVNRMSALAAGRLYAALSVAQHHATQNVVALPPSEVGEPGSHGQHEVQRGAVAGASFRVLRWFFPTATTSLEQMLAQQAKGGTSRPRPRFQRGVNIGRKAGDLLIERVQNDGFTAPWTGTVPVGPGIWIPNSLPPAGATLGSVTPYFLTSGSQFRPAPPPAFGSGAFNTDLNEVATVTQNRTAEELAIALYWDFPAGTPTPIGYWNDAAATYVEQHNLDEQSATQVFALLHATMFDALIACWEAKYHYWTIRPSQADPAIALAFGVPNFPSYPSGHSCASSSAGRVLTHFFPDRADELADWVTEAGVSRIYAGIHYRFDVTVGQELGNAVAEWAIAQNTP